MPATSSIRRLSLSFSCSYLPPGGNQDDVKDDDGLHLWKRPPMRQQVTHNQRLDALFGPSGRIARGSGSLLLDKRLWILQELA